MKRSAASAMLLSLIACLPVIARPLSARAQATGEPILVSALADEDRASAERLAELVDEPIEVVLDPSARDPSHACRLARARGRALFGLFDGAAGRVHVGRARDCMVLTRDIEDAERTPYTAAFVAAELLTLARLLDREAQVQRERERAPSVLVTLGLGAGVDVALRGPYRPRALLLAALTRRRAERVLGLDLAILAGIEARAQDDSALGRVRAQRTDLALRGGPSLTYGRTHLVGFAQAGLALTAVNVLDDAERRAGFTLGAGLALRLRVAGPLALFAQGSCAGALPRRDYRVQGTSVLREPLLTVNLELGLSVHLHSR